MSDRFNYKRSEQDENCFLIEIILIFTIYQSYLILMEDC